MYRSKFITNSSSTCFVAYGVEVEIIDQEKADVIFKDEISEEDGIVIEWTDTGFVFCWLDSEMDAAEYALWQNIEHPYLNELVRKEADAGFERLAKKYGCQITQGPFWGLYNSGH